MQIYLNMRKSQMNWNKYFFFSKSNSLNSKRGTSKIWIRIDGISYENVVEL